MYNGKKVSIIFPAYNEEENIKNAIEEFFAEKVVDEIIVVDNNSTDNTAKEIAKTKAKYIFEKKQGYGNALQAGITAATGDYLITAEPDGTFLAKDILKLLLYSDDFDVVFGTRTSKECIRSGANMDWFLRVGNCFVAKNLEYVYNGPCLTDVGCTLKLIKREVLKQIQPKFTVGTSHFSPEIMILCIRNGFKCVEIPVNYKARIGTSKITGNFWKALKLGFIMLWMIYTYSFWNKK